MNFVNAYSAVGYSVNSLTITKAKPPLFGNALIVGVFFNQGSGSATISMPGATFTNRVRKVSGSYTLEIWESVGYAERGSMNNILITLPVSSGPCGAIAMEFEGVNKYDVSGSASGASTTITSGSVTTTQTNEIAVAFIFDGPNDATSNGSSDPLNSITNGFTLPANSTARATYNTGGGKFGNTTEWVLYGFYKVLTSTGVQSVSANISNPGAIGNIPYIGGISTYYNINLGTNGCCVIWTCDSTYKSALANALYAANAVTDNDTNDISTYIEDVGVGIKEVFN